MSKTQEPAVHQPEANKAGPELFMIEELKAKKKTSAPIYSGVCTVQNWGPGKVISEADYDAAVKAFSFAPMGKRVE